MDFEAAGFACFVAFGAAGLAAAFGAVAFAEALGAAALAGVFGAAALAGVLGAAAFAGLEAGFEATVFAGLAAAFGAAFVVLGAVAPFFMSDGFTRATMPLGVVAGFAALTDFFAMYSSLQKRDGLLTAIFCLFAANSLTGVQPIYGEMMNSCKCRENG